MPACPGPINLSLDEIKSVPPPLSILIPSLSKNGPLGFSDLPTSYIISTFNSIATFVPINKKIIVIPVFMNIRGFNITTLKFFYGI